MEELGEFNINTNQQNIINKLGLTSKLQAKQNDLSEKNNEIEKLNTIIQIK